MLHWNGWIMIQICSQGRNQDFAKGGLKWKNFVTSFWWRILGIVIWCSWSWYSWRWPQNDQNDLI